MDIKPYDEARDLKDIQRIWYEVGWVENEAQAACIKDFMCKGSCLTARLDGVAECVVHVVPGSIRHVSRDLKLCAVTAVTTSRIARKQGFAQKLTALQLADAADAGAQVAALGMFDQGFYDKLGFGTGAYDHQFTFDPATLIVDVPFRIPARLGAEDWQKMHACMTSRLRGHGSVNLNPAETFRAEVGFTDHGYGLGYHDDNGELTHFLWIDVRGEHGPYVINAFAYRTTDQLLELLSLLKALADQVSSVKMMQPPHVQLQMLLKLPFRTRRNTRLSEHGNEHRAVAWWQIRLLSLDALAGYCWPAGELQFNLELNDPISVQLEDRDEGRWRGITGSYVVSIGPHSSIREGHDAQLPTLQASVNAFSRLFFGVAPASVLTTSDELSGPDELIAQLDQAFLLPQPNFDWDF